MRWTGIYWRRGALPLVIVVLAIIFAPVVGRAAKNNPVYTISNFEVWAEADNAVSAKKAALEDGRVVALGLLLKRLTLYTSYKNLPEVSAKDASRMITGLKVQDERNSKTEYLANMDFQFSKDRVKKLLRERRIAYYDRQGPQVIVVPVVDKSLLVPTGAENKPIISQADWETSWKTLDLAHGLVPIKIAPRSAALDDSVLVALLRSERSALDGMAASYKSPFVVLALLSSSQSTKKLRLTLIGKDGVGELSYRRDHVVSAGNILQAADVAAEVAQGMMEQRLKILRLRPLAAVAKGPVEVLPWQTNMQEAPPVTGWQGEVGGQRIVMHVPFRGLRHWQSIRQKLSSVNGLEGLNVEKLSARGADVSCEFPGGAAALSRQLAAYGMRLSSDGGGWVLEDGS